MKRLTFALLSVTLFLGACKNDKSTETTEEPASAEAAVQDGYTFQPAFTKVNWTAFKTNAKVPVSGTFTEMEITPGKAGGSLSDIMNGLSFSLNTSSVSSNDEGRDFKISTFFFGKMAKTSTISGTVGNIQGDETGGTATISIRMNEIDHEVEGTYRLNGNKVTLETMLDMADWNGLPAISALNTVCEALHTGEDGVSKLWPEVKVVVTSTLKGSAPAS